MGMVTANNERLTVDAPAAFRALGVSRNSGYAAIKAGTFPLPVIKVGKRLLIPKIAIERLLGENGNGEQ
jgi:predicted DNA-binding transcriptional regulator AlpA